MGGKFVCVGGGTHNAILITLVQINFQRQVVLRDRVRKNIFNELTMIQFDNH